MTTSQVHEFLKFKVSEVFDELTITSGLEINYSRANLDHIASVIEDYMLLGEVPGIVDEFPAEQNMEVDEYD